MSDYRTPPPGWFDFGTHVDHPDVQLEFSSQGTDGLPLWERPVDYVEATDANPERRNNGCQIYRAN